MNETMQVGGRQQGVMLLEALIAILIFSIGILAVVGMQATAVKTATESKVRSEAAFLANQLVSQMWSDAGNAAEYAYDGTGAPPERLERWIDEINRTLPGAADLPPKVTVIDPTSQGATVEIELYWRHPEETTLDLPAHKHLIRAAIYTS